MTAKRTLGRYHRQEIEELTDLLRNDSDWDEQRRFLTRRGMNPKHLVMASFCEDEDGNEYGVVVTREHEVFEYSRSIDLPKRRGRVKSWQDVTGSKEAIKDWPQISVALEIVDDMVWASADAILP